MNKNTKLLFVHKLLYDVYFYGAITVPFFVAKGYGVSAALAFASAHMVISMAMEVPTGIVGDRYGHRSSVMSGVFLTGVGLIGFLLVDNLLWDSLMMVLFSTGAALTSGSDTALLRSASNDFERDNRTFDYLKNSMLLLSFGAAGFVVTLTSIEVAIGLSGVLAFVSLPPLMLVQLDDSGKKLSKNTSINQQIADLPKALKKVRGGLALIILAGIAGAITFSAKEIISSFNTVYDVDISLIGIIAALAMAGRIVGTALEKRLGVTRGVLLVLLSLVVGLTVTIEFNRVLGIAFMLLSTVVAQMLFYRLKYILASEAPQSHVASLVSGLSLIGRFVSGGMIMLTGIFAGAGYFHLSFIALSLVVVIFGGYLAGRLDRAVTE